MPNHEDHPLTSWRNPWVVLAAIVTVVIVLVGLAGIRFVMDGGRPGFARAARFGLTKQVAEPGPGMKIMAQGGAQVDGVITAANGNHLTVAGGGTTTTVDTTSSTQYSGATSAAVNDSVVVLGSLSNGTFTATRIVVNP